MSKTSTENEEIECFVIMPISDQNGYDNGHFTLVYDDIIKPAIYKNNMTPKRADEIKNTNLIQLEILKKIIEIPIAVCDMSSKNPNVFYELGMRQAFDMPTVLMIDDETVVPFDISSLRYIKYPKNMKYREVNDAIEELSECIKATYCKRNDKSEINSLIRLMDLTKAEIKPSNISNSEKIKLLHEIELKEIKTEISKISTIQNKILMEFKRIIINEEFKKANDSISLTDNLSFSDIFKRSDKNYTYKDAIVKGLGNLD